MRNAVRAFWLLAVLCGCGTSPPSGPAPRDTASWSGTYLLSSTKWQQHRASGYTELWLGPRGTFYWRVVDQAFPQLQWVAQGTLEDATDSARLRCRSGDVRRQNGDRFEVLYQRRPGSAPVYPPAADRAVVDGFLSGSDLLNRELPAVMKECGDEPLVFRKEGGRSALAQVTWRGTVFPLENASSSAFARLLSSVHRTQSRLPLWSEADGMESFAKSWVVFDPRNALLPSPPAHAYFVLPRLALGTGTRLADGENMALQWTRDQGARGETNDRAINREIAEATWAAPTPTRVRVWVDDALWFSRALTARETPERAAKLVVKLPAELPPQARLRVEIGYDAVAWRSESLLGWQRTEVDLRAGVIDRVLGIEVTLGGW